MTSEVETIGDKACMDVIQARKGDVANEPPQDELVPAIGMEAAMAFFESVAPDEFNRQKRRIGHLQMASDDKSWYHIDGTLGGDPFDFLARFGSSRTRAEWIETVKSTFKQLAPEDREVLEPGAAAIEADDSFPLSALPSVLRELSHDLAELHGVPVQFPASVAIAVTGAAVGRGLRLKTWRGMTAYPNLYVLIGMLSGLGKSSVMKPVFAPLFSYERRLEAEHASRLPRIEAELAIVQKEIATIQKGSTKNIDDTTLQTLAKLKTRETALLLDQIAPRVVVEDVTSQKLATMMEENGETLASLSPDARGAGKILLGRYNEGNLDEDIYLKAFSGDSCRQDRIGRLGASLDDPALTIVWATQPDLFDQLFNSKVSSTSGLACRFLPIRIDGCLNTASYEEESAATGPLEKFTDLIDGLLAGYHQHTSEAHTISADSKAREVISTYQRRIWERISEGELAHIGGFALRWAEIAWRLTLIFHCAENGEAAHLKFVSEQTAANAVQVMKWFARHQQELLNRGEEQSNNDKLSIALAFANRSPAGVTAWDLYRHKQTLFDNVADARAALDKLEGEGSLVGEQSRKSRRFFRKSVPRTR